MDYKTDKRIINIQTSVTQGEVENISKRPWFKVVRRENTPLWESLIQAGGALSDKTIEFDNPMRDLYALDYDKYADEDNFETLKDQFIEKCKKDSQFLTKFFSNLDKESEEFDLFVQKVSKTAWEKVTDTELSESYNQFVNHSLRVLTFLWPPLAPEEWIVEKISGEVAQKIDPIKDYELHHSTLQLLLKSPVPSLMQKRDDAIAELAARIGSVDKISKFKQEIESVHQTYAWINDHSLRFEYETKEHFDATLITALEGDPVTKWEQLLAEKEEELKSREEVVKKMALPPEIMDYVYQASHLAHWRFLRVEKPTEAAYYLQGMFREICKRFNFDNILLCYYWEIANLFDGKTLNREKIAERKNGYGLLIAEDKIYDLNKEDRVVVKNEIESKIELGKIVKGNVACRGFVKGRVRVLHSAKDLATFENKEILVTAMTTPEYVPVMKMASAIVTDEGGISCHAAIVSRELKVPCVIGTKNATKILKTGDMVEVDANQGVVRVIK